jgi:hypothetical protein
MPDGSGKITKFDKAHYDQLITYLTTFDDVVNRSSWALGPSSDLKLDSTLTSTFHPGSQDWSVVKNFVTQAGVFAGSVHNRYTAIETDTRTFSKALKGAEDVFDDTDDLSTYDASKYESDYPDVAGGGTT